jgi:hypothetical protein
MAGRRAFVARLNRVDPRLRDEALFDLRLNWSEEVATACAFDVFPEWVMRGAAQLEFSARPLKGQEHGNREGKLGVECAHSALNGRCSER